MLRWGSEGGGRDIDGLGALRSLTHARAKGGQAARTAMDTWTVCFQLATGDDDEIFHFSLRLEELLHRALPKVGEELNRMIETISPPERPIQ